MLNFEITRGKKKKEKRKKKKKLLPARSTNEQRDKDSLDNIIYFIRSLDDVT